MRVLIFHGYLLRGTGSNVYNAELAKALARLGHEVHLFCQDIHANDLAWIDAVGDWDAGSLRTEVLRQPTQITAYRPNIGSTLPVYVADRYEQFEARPFNELAPHEVEAYIDANVAAVREVAELVKPEAALANHAIMGPCILARALDGGNFAAKVHGSALEYQVKPYPRFKPYAAEGLESANTVLVGSRHTAESLWQAFPELNLQLKTRLGPPGVDIELFAPRDTKAAVSGFVELARLLQETSRDGFSLEASDSLDRLALSIDQDPIASEQLAEIRATYDPSGIDENAPRAASNLDPTTDRIVSFVGKLIVSKGVDLVLLAWPLVRQAVPNAKLAISGFGAYREGLELLMRALSRGDLSQLRWLLAQGRALEGGPKAPLSHGLDFLDSLRGPDEARYVEAALDIEKSIVWFGRLEHELLVHVVTASELQIVSSTFPEAYGMVAAEAAAAGAFPIVAAHSGLAEVARDLAPALDPEVASYLSFGLGPNAVRDLADRIIGFLGLDATRREDAANALRQVACDNFSWEQVAQEMIEASRGENAGLRRP